MTMGDRVAVMKDGVLQQIDSPQNLYDQPANVFVAGFIGSPAMNLCSAYVRDNGIEVGGANIAIPADILAEARNRGLSEVTIGFRPEDMQLTDGMAIAVEFVEVLGVDAYVYGTIETAHGQQNVVIRTDGRRPPKAGDTIHVNVKDGHVHVFDSNTGARLGK